MKVLSVAVSRSFSGLAEENSGKVPGKKRAKFLGKKKTITMTKISSQKTCYTYGHGPLKSPPEEEKNDDHDQDSLKKCLVHIWSWSSDYSWKKGKDPHPQDKIQHLDFTKDLRLLFYKSKGASKKVAFPLSSKRRF